MKNYNLLITGFILTILSSSKVIAQQQGGFLNDLGIKGLLQAIFDILNTPLQIPNLVVDSQEVSLWLLILAFMVVFSVLYLASQNIPLFKDAPKGPIKMFSIAISLLVIFTTGFLNSLLSLIGTFTSLGMLAVLVLGIYTMWTLFKTGWSEQSEKLAEANERSANASKLDVESKTLNDEAKASNKALNKQKRTLDRLTGKNRLFGLIKGKGTIGLDIENNKKLLKQLDRLSNALGESAQVTGEEQQKIIGNSLKELKNAISKLKTNTQHSLQRINRLDNILYKSKDEELAHLETIKKNIESNLDDIQKNTELEDKLKSQVIANLKNLYNLFKQKEQEYSNCIENFKRLNKAIRNNDSLKFESADQVVKSIDSGLIPPDSGQHIQALRNTIGQEIYLDEQLTNEVKKSEKILSELKSMDKSLDAVINEEKKGVSAFKKLANKIKKRK